MSRRIPLCAWCGRPMKGKRRASWRVKCEGLPGMPEFGWHTKESGGCLQRDHLGDFVGFPRKMCPRAVMREIEQRGPGRVVKNRSGRFRATLAAPR